MLTFLLALAAMNNATMAFDMDIKTYNFISHIAAGSMASLKYLLKIITASPMLSRERLDVSVFTFSNRSRILL